MQKKLLIFDLDGTLIDSQSDLRHAVNHMRKELGLAALSLDTVARYVGDGMRKLVERSLQGHDTDVDEATEIFFTYYKTHLWDDTILYPGVEDGLHQLHADGHTLTLMSNKPADACRLLLDHFNMTPLMSQVIGGGDTPHRKPDPEPLLHIINTQKAYPADTWMVGDNFTDLGAARRAKTKSIFVTYGLGETRGEPADLVCDSFDEVTDFFIRGAS